MTPRLDVKLLGGTAIELNGRPVKSLPTRAAQALFIYLIHQSHPVEREKLIDMFYQASTPKQAAANFRSTLSRIRKELAPFLIIDTRTVAIDPEAQIEIDARNFELWIAGDRWEAGLTLYQGEFLAGFSLRDAPEFEQWALVERERLRLLAQEGLRRQVAEQLAAADYWQALQTVNRLLGIEPLLEEMQRLRLLLLARTGQRPLALQQYQATAALFEEELGLPLEAETTALFERISRLKSPPPTNLAPPSDSFIGRQKEIEHLTKLLAQPDRRLITLFGLGGIGKTRLALETARQLMATRAGQFLDGIFFVSLVGVDTLEGVARQLMQGVDLPLAGGAPASEQALVALAPREMLLIFDNVEHVLDDCAAFIPRLLEAAPEVKLLTTSRERLNLVEETVFDLAGLPLNGAAPLESEAARLFVSHAQRQRFTFAPEGDEVPAIDELCHLLEGIPLGLELAAGGIREQGCVALAEQIRSTLKALASPLRNVPERHRSLRAVFLHSWALLTPELQLIFAQLSVFPAGFTAAAAEAVAGSPEQEVGQLVDKALLKLENGRYAIHPLLREFAAEQVADTAQSPLRDRHTAYFAQQIHTYTQTYHRPTYLQYLPELVEGYDDLLKAWRWTFDQLLAGRESGWEWLAHMRRPLVRLHFQKNWFYAVRTLYEAARQKLEEAGWHLPEATERQRLLHAQLTVTACNAARILGEVQIAIPPLETAVPRLRQAAALDDLYDAYNALVGSRMQLGQFDNIPELLDEMEALAFELNKPVLFGVLYVVRSYYTDFMGDPAQALTYAYQGLEAFREMEDTYYEAIVLDGIARRLASLQRPHEGAEALRRAYVLAEENGMTLTMAFVQKGLAAYHQQQGELEAAEAALACSRELFVETNEQRNLVEVDFLQGLVAMERENWSVMTRYLLASFKRARAQAVAAYTLKPLLYLPLLDWQRGEAEQAYRLARYFLNGAELSDEDRQAVETVVEKMGGLPPKSQPAADIQAAPLDLEAVGERFLREGLTWFAAATD